MKNDLQTMLASCGLRDTQPRRLVLQALMKTRVPQSQKEIFESLRKHGNAINLVTVYRMLRQFLEVGIVHLHPTTGGFILCSGEGKHDCHSFMTCEQCGSVEEFHDEKLCKEEDRVAKRAGFLPRHHVSDIVGTCTHCQ